MGLEQLHLEGIDKVQFSIDLIQANQPANEPYYLCDSGGKDSRALRQLCDLAKSPYEAHYHSNPFDPPEIPHFLKEYYPNTIFDHMPEPIFRIFNDRGYPLRSRRWCCKYIKEWGGANRTILLGVRSEESSKRKTRCFISWNEKGRTKYDKGTTRNVISPMLLWTQQDVWTFLEKYKVPYIPLYDEGSSGTYKGDGNIQRLGCAMCPCAGAEERLAEYKRYPVIANIWYKAFVRLWNHKRGIKPDWESRFENVDQLFWWWMNPPKKKKIKNQLKLLEVSNG